MTKGSRALFLLAPPLALLAAAEVGMRAAGVRVPRYAGLARGCDYWVPVSAPGKPDGYVRAFPRSYRFHPEPIPLFLREKPAAGFRVFAIGESSVFGWPYDVGGFTDWMRARLRGMLPGRVVEVVNGGNPGWPAFDTRTLLRESLEHRPDLVLWMAGDSEFVPQNIQRLREEVTSPAAARLRRELYESRVLRLLSALSPTLGDPRLFLDETSARDEVPCYGPELDLLKRRYREILAGAVADARAAGVPILLCTLPRNAREKPPLGSFFSEALREDRTLHDRWDRLYADGLDRLDARRPDEALARFEEARALDADPAKLHFAMGRAHEAAGRPAEARAAFLRAVELDACPMRAPQWIDDAIRAVAAESGTPVVDLRAAFDRAGKDGLAGYEWLIDNVHPNLEGHEKIADELLLAMERELRVPLERSRDPSRARVRAEIGLDRYDAYLQARSACTGSLEAALLSGAPDDRWRRARAAGETALASVAEDWEVVGSLGLLESIGGDAASARARIERAMHSDAFVRTSFLARRAVAPHWRRAFDAARVDVAAIEASLSEVERLVVDNRVARLRSR